jgi:hypothetical protein
MADGRAAHSVVQSMTTIVRTGYQRSTAGLCSGGSSWSVYREALEEWWRAVRRALAYGWIEHDDSWRADSRVALGAAARPTHTLAPNG